jgi:hypothetical protein
MHDLDVPMAALISATDKTQVIFVRDGTQGYWQGPKFFNKRDAAEYADRANAALGVPPAEREARRMRSMFAGSPATADAFPRARTYVEQLEEPGDGA